MLLRRVSIPFDRVVGELGLPLRGIIPPGTFVTARTSSTDGWDRPNLPVPELTSRRAKQLYNRGIIAPRPTQTVAPLVSPMGEAASHKGKGKH